MHYTLAKKSQLDARELFLLESEVRNHGQNMVVAYLLWWFLGMFGAHRFYTKRIGSAVAQLILTLTVFGAIITFFWWLVDVFLVQSWVKEHNSRIENYVIDQMLYSRGAAGGGFPPPPAY